MKNQDNSHQVEPAQILIIDDDSAVCDSMAEFMEACGYRSLKAYTAEDGVALLERESVDIVITDIILPGMDGLALTDKIRTDYDADVIVMTGYSGDYSYEEAVDKGASDFVFKPIRYQELMLRIKRVLRERKLTQERVKMLNRLEKLAITDGLTKLYNSRHFYEQIELEIERSNRYRHPLSLLVLDIDYFKCYNDRYGHLEGDKVLNRLGNIIKSCLRKMDTAYRYGGEEFTVLLPETKAIEAGVVAVRIKDNIKKELFNPEPGKMVNITISSGITEYCYNEKATKFVKRADQAMYVSKKQGRDRITTLTCNGGEPASGES